MSVQTTGLNFLFISTENFQLILIGSQTNLFAPLLSLQLVNNKNFCLKPNNEDLKNEVAPQGQIKEEEPRKESSIQVLLNNVDVDLVEKAEKGLQIYEPERAEEGVNGAFFLKDSSGKNIAVFKPREVEISSDNKHESKILPEGIPLENTPEREVAAYLLDRQGFYGVPPTTLISVKHPSFGTSKKEGSFQKFIENDGAAWDIGSSLFPISEVHKIGVLDLHLFNCDRHAGNILYKKTNDSYSLIPIDNGFSLPSPPNFNILFEWMSWKQAKVPFDSKTKDFIEKIDIEADMRLISQELKIPLSSLESMKISTTLLKKGAAHNLTLYEIGSIISRTDIQVPSILETIYKKAKSLSGNDQNLLYQFLFQFMDEEIAKIKP